MFHIERIYDLTYVYNCLTHPKVWEHSRDDAIVNPGLFFPNNAESIYYLQIEHYGLFVCHRTNHVSLDVHLALLPHARGKALELSKAAIAWTFNQYPILRMTASIPAYNKLAISLAKRCGFDEYGINKESFMKNNILYDQVCLGLSKPKGGV